MQSEIYTVGSVIACIPATILGSKAANFIGQMAPGMPEWAHMLLGPLGALVGLLFAVVWLAKRLKEVEAKNDVREERRQQDRVKLIEVLTLNTETIREAKDTIREAKDTFKETKELMHETRVVMHDVK